MEIVLSVVGAFVGAVGGWLSTFIFYKNKNRQEGAKAAGSEIQNLVVIIKQQTDSLTEQRKDYVELSKEHKEQSKELDQATSKLARMEALYCSIYPCKSRVNPYDPTSETGPDKCASCTEKDVCASYKTEKV